MAIARVAKGTTLKVDTSATAGPYNVALPAGHLSGHLILLFVTTDDNTNATPEPSGWTRLFYITNGSSVGTPYTPRVRTKCFYRIDNGSLGSSVTLSFDTSSSWPTGKPSVLAYTVAYSGCDTTGPIERWDFFSTTTTGTAQAHPQVTTTSANAWLLSFRAVSSDAPGATFTCSVGTDTEVQDDTDTIPELACALYDSNAALAAGLQTQRTTTASRAATYGGLAASIVLKPSGAASATPSAGNAEAIASALDATVTTVDGPWDLCGTSGLPQYTFAVDWGGDGLLAAGTALNPNPYLTYDLTDWSAVNASMARNTTAFGYPVLSLTSTAGASPRVQAGQWPVIVGRTYRAVGWLYTPASVPTTSELNVNWFDASHAYLSTSTNVSVLTAGQWTKFDATFTAPASAAYGSVLMAFGGTPGAGYVLYGYGLTLIDPSTGEQRLIPSPGDDLTSQITSGITITYGRDQSRQLNPAAVGGAAFTVINVDRTFSPDVVTSVLYGDLEPAQQAAGTVQWNGDVYPLLTSRMDDYNVRADMTNRTVDFTFLDGMNDLQNIKLSTSVYKALRTGELINIVLDFAGWTGPRDIDLGASLIPYWWIEGTDALSAITDLVKSEGPPSVAYQAPDGTFVFRDRHHRLRRTESTGVQAVFSQPVLMDCTSPPVTGDLNFTAPFTYTHGARDIINSVTFEVSDRVEDADLTAVWTQEDQISLSNGESTVIQASGSDPFIDAAVPVAGTDYILGGSGTASITLSRTSGQSTVMTILAVGGNLTISNFQLRARAITVQKSIKVSRVDADSITRHGEKAYPDAAPWASANDADAIAGMILLHYARRRPTVQLRVTTSDPAHFVQCLTRTVSDRVHITYGEMGIDDDFFVESVQHAISRLNQTGKPPVHAITLGCERDLVRSSNPFTFDKRGAGFDQGTFDPIQSDQADTVFIFDHPTQGQFDVGLFGT